MTEFFEVQVLDPMKMIDKYGGSFTGYTLKTNTNRSNFSGVPSEVTRRYNDFDWLSKELGKKYPGVIVPPLPEKNTFNKFSSDFLETRRRGLEKFLIRISEHRDLGHDSIFSQFLETNEEGFHDLKNGKLEKKEKHTFSEKAQIWLNSKYQKVEIEHTEADNKIQEISHYIKGLQKQMASVMKNGASMLKKEKEISQAYFEFAQSFTYLGQSEGEAVGNVFIELGKSVESVCHTNDTKVGKIQTEFLEPLTEYSRTLESIKKAVSARQEVKSALMNCLVDLETRQQAYQKVAGVEGKESSAAIKEAAVQNAQENADKAKVEYDNVSKTLLSDFDEFRHKKAHEIKKIIVDFVVFQIDFHSTSERLWAELYPKIERMNVSVEEGNYTALNTAFESGLIVDDALNLSPIDLPPPIPNPTIGDYSSTSNSNFREEDHEELEGV